MKANPAMKSLLYLSALAHLFLHAQESPKMLHSNAVEIKKKLPNGEVQTFTIARDIDIRCRKVDFDGKTHWSGDYVAPGVPKYCQKSFITTAGKLSPMKIDDNIETFGELEVLEFIEEMQEDSDMLFIDTRKPEWFHARTIPTAVNIPFFLFTEPQKHPQAYKEALAYFGIMENNGVYDFSKAKTLLLFCNGTWCRQSPQMIEALIKLGYPAQKMKWYRGGLQAWLNVNLTSVTGSKSTR